MNKEDEIIEKEEELEKELEQEEERHEQEEDYLLQLENRFNLIDEKLEKIFTKLNGTKEDEVKEEVKEVIINGENMEEPTEPKPEAEVIFDEESAPKEVRKKNYRFLY